MPRTTCLLPGCTSNDSDCKFHYLPRIDALRAVWMQYLLPLLPSLRSLTKSQLVNIKICRRHFEAKYIKRDGKRVGNCAPTLFTKEEIESGIPSKPLPSDEPERLLNEHSYSYKRPHTDHNYSQKVNEVQDQDQETTDIDNIPDDDVAAHADWPGDADEPEDLLATVPNLTNTNNKRSDGIHPQSQFTANPQRIKKFNEVQYFMDEFIKEIQGDIDYQAPEDSELLTTKGKFADELKTYNLTSEVITTNRHVKPYDQMDNLMYSEKAYAAITFCLLRQQDLFEQSIRDFLMWASKSEIDYESLEKRVGDIFENGEFIQISFKILQIICKYRMKTIEIRKESIANQALDPEMKESLRKIPHSSLHLFNDDDLRSTLESAPNISKVFLPNEKSINLRIKSKSKFRTNRAIQVNILPKKADKTVQVKPKIVRKAGKCVQVNSNELESIATAKKVKKKDTGSQTTEKDKLLSGTIASHENPPLRERSEVMEEDSPISHCQKIQYVVNIKRQTPRHERITNVNNDLQSLESNVQAGTGRIDYPQSQHDKIDYNRIETDNKTSHCQDSFQKSKKKRKVTKIVPEPSMPVLWDACQNLLSLGGGSNINETETEQVHSTLERKSVTPKIPKSQKRPGRPNFGKKRRPKTPETLKEQSSPIKSTGTSPMKDMSDSFQMTGKSMNTLHVCDSPYLLGGCKHTYDPQSESVPPSSVHRSQGIQRSANIGYSGGKRRRHDISEPSRSIYIDEVPRNSDLIESAPVIVQSQNPDTNLSSPLLLLTYDNLLPRWP